MKKTFIKKIAAIIAVSLTLSTGSSILSIKQLMWMLQFPLKQWQAMRPLYIQQAMDIHRQVGLNLIVDEVSSYTPVNRCTPWFKLHIQYKWSLFLGFIIMISNSTNQDLLS